MISIALLVDALRSSRSGRYSSHSVHLGDDGDPAGAQLLLHNQLLLSFLVELPAAELPQHRVVRGSEPSHDHHLLET